MTSDELKENIVRKIQNACMGWATQEQLHDIETATIIALHGVELAQTETALSTEFAHPNEWYLQQFLAIKRIKGLSPKSLKAYQVTVEKFMLTIDKPIPEITANDIRYYLAIRETRDGLSKVSLRNELLNLRSFFATMTAEEYIARNPTAKVDIVKVEKKVKEPFTEMELEQIRRACGTNRKHIAIVETLYSTGCRVSELCGMDRADIQGDKILVTGKGNKQRWVYLNPRAQMAIKDYLDGRTDEYPALFIGENAKLHELTERISKGGVEAMCRKLGKRAGVENVHPHRFRRTAATVALRRGMPIEQVSRMLGHEEIGTTQIYAITADEEVHESHMKYLT